MIINKTLTKNIKSYLKMWFSSLSNSFLFFQSIPKHSLFLLCLWKQFFFQKCGSRIHQFDNYIKVFISTRKKSKKKKITAHPSTLKHGKKVTISLMGDIQRKLISHFRWRRARILCRRKFSKNQYEMGLPISK